MSEIKELIQEWKQEENLAKVQKELRRIRACGALNDSPDAEVDLDLLNTRYDSTRQSKCERVSLCAPVFVVVGDNQETERCVPDTIGFNRSYFYGAPNLGNSDLDSRGCEFVNVLIQTGVSSDETSRAFCEDQGCEFFHARNPGGSGVLHPFCGLPTNNATNNPTNNPTKKKTHPVYRTL